jgi:redox-sensing transcriptional repressor
MSQSFSKNADQPDQPVPKAVVSRLSLYLRELQLLLRDGRATTSSTELGRQLGFSNAQVRKDLAYFGQFGYPGIGYRCDELIREIKKILGTNQSWPVVIVGMGNLGRALIGYRGFDNQGFKIVAAFDSDPNKQGAVLEGVPIYPLEKMPEIITQQGIKLAILAVPAASAQGVAESVVQAGITGILNFAPVTLSLSKSIQMIGVDLAIELEQLAFSVVHGKVNGEETSGNEEILENEDDSTPE